MTKKWIALGIIIFFAASAMPAFADEGPGSESVFQAIADPIAEFTGKTAPPDKYRSEGALQTIANTISGIGKKTAAGTEPPDGVFQSAADGLSEFTSWLKGEKSTYTEPPTGAFQEAKEYIVETIKGSPNMRASSLRGREDEIARRRGLR